MKYEKPMIEEEIIEIESIMDQSNDRMRLNEYDDLDEDQIQLMLGLFLFFKKRVTKRVTK